MLETAFDSGTRRRGLLGRDDLAAGTAMVLAPCNAVHTCRMRFPIDVVFAARDGRVTRSCGGWPPGAPPRRSRRSRRSSCARAPSTTRISLSAIVSSSGRPAPDLHLVREHRLVLGQTKSPGGLPLSRRDVTIPTSNTATARRLSSADCGTQVAPLAVDERSPTVCPIRPSSSPATGRARTVSDCVVESWDGESAVVATGQPARQDDQLTLQFNSPGRRDQVVPGARAVVRNGYPARASAIQIAPPGDGRLESARRPPRFPRSLAPWARPRMTNAVLLRDIPLAVRDVSSGGCLIESSAPLQVGTIGWLEVEFEGERRFEWFRVARVQRVDEHVCSWPASSSCRSAAAGADSLRSAIGRLRRSPRASRGGRCQDDRDGTVIVRPGTQQRVGAGNTESRARILDFSRRRS